MNIKRIIKEEIDGLEWIKNVKSNQDIAQEIADNTEIKNERLYIPFSYPPAPSFFSLFSLRPTSLSFFPFPSSLSFSFTKYCKEQYGLTKKEIQDIWKRYKDIIIDKINDHHNINESDDMEGLEWIQDIKSNQDIAQDIADKTKIKNNRIYSPYLPSSFPFPSLFLPRPSFYFSSFIYYCEKQYGLNDDENIDIWERYKDIIIDKINDHHNINESEDKNIKRIIKE